MNKLAKKLTNLILAEQVVITELRTLYPAGKEVSFIIMSGQFTPSRGIVINHEGGRFGYVLVKLHSRTQQIRRVAAKDILQ